MSLDQKIQDLFLLRKLPYLLEGTANGVGSKFYSNLLELQTKIYELDLYIEENWVVDQTELDHYWSEIHKTLSLFGVAKKDFEDYLKHIHIYLKHELNLREGKLPFEMTMEYFYFYKSCDVKLLRRLIYDQVPELSRKYKLSDWRVFDIITELHDDVEDVYEDIDVINGNLFMLSISSKGLAHTIDIFQDIIHEMEQRIDEKFMKSKNDHDQELLQWTKKAAMNLNVLLMDRRDELKSNPIKEPKVLTILSE